MLGKLAGALIGAEIERKRRQSGVKGAVLGVAATAVLRRLGPLGLLIGGVYVARKALKRGKPRAS